MDYGKILGLPRPTPLITNLPNCLGGVMVGMLALSAVDHGFKTKSGQIKSQKNCSFCTKPAALTCKNKDWLDQSQDNVSEWTMSTCGLFFSNY